MRNYIINRKQIELKADKELEIELAKSINSNTTIQIESDYKGRHKTIHIEAIGNSKFSMPIIIDEPIKLFSLYSDELISEMNEQYNFINLKSREDIKIAISIYED